MGFFLKKKKKDSMSFQRAQAETPQPHSHQEVVGLYVKKKKVNNKTFNVKCFPQLQFPCWRLRLVTPLRLFT